MVYFWSSVVKYFSSNFDFAALNSFDLDYSKNFLKNHWNSIYSESLKNELFLLYYEQLLLFEFGLE